MWETLDVSGPAAPRVGDLVRAYDPAVVVETLGLNYFMWLNFTPATMNAQVRRYVAEARDAKPGVEVVLGAVPQTWWRHVPEFNAGLPALAAELSTPRSRVFASPVAEFAEGVDTYDNTHPTTADQVKIATAVSLALEQLGIGRAITMPMPSTPGGHDPIPSSRAGSTASGSEPRRTHNVVRVVAHS